MVKLYFKKLFSVLSLFLMWLAVAVVISMMLGLQDAPTIDYTAYSICMAVSGVICAVCAGVIMAHNSRDKTEYITDALTREFKFGREILSIIKTKSFIAEQLAFITWLIPLLVYICTFPENASLPLWTMIASSLTVMLVFTAVFAVIDTIIRFAVRRIWMRSH